MPEIARYKGQLMKAFRPATPDDKGYDAGKGRQVIVTSQDGKEQMVPLNDVHIEAAPPPAPEQEETAQQVQQTDPAQPPHQANPTDPSRR